MSRPTACSSTQVGTEDFDQGIKLRRSVLAGNDEAEVAVSRAAEVVDVRGMNARAKERALELCPPARSAGMDGNDGTWTVIDRVAGLTQSGFHIAGVETEATTEFGVGLENFQGSPSTGHEWKRERRVPDKEPAALDDLVSHFLRGDDRAAVNPKGFAESHGLNEARHGLDCEVLRRAAASSAKDAGAVGIIDE